MAVKFYQWYVVDSRYRPQRLTYAGEYTTAGARQLLRSVYNGLDKKTRLELLRLDTVIDPENEETG